ncbi:MAG: hypothetical protein QF664_14390 [Dehalococcoidia bacterium]|nr:hypothetical protein [Dehalococcoidia bacterium]
MPNHRSHRPKSLYGAALAAALLLLTSPVGAAWEMSEFVIYLWNPPQAGTPEEKAEALAAAGFTVVDWDPDQLDVLSRHGLKGMVHNATPELAERIRSHPALWGYHLVDEPYPESQFPPIAERMRAIEAVDPDHPPFVNMLSTTGEFLRTYMRIVRPPLLSFDYYQWTWGSDRYFAKLEQFRDQAILAGVPLGSCIETTANPAIERGDTTYVADNALKLRQSVYTNLAYGVTMVEWFSAGRLFEPGTLELTPSGRDVAALNAELKRVGPMLVGLRSIDVYHTAPLPRGTRSAPQEHWVRLVGEADANGLVLGMFEDAEGADYAMVVNRDYRRAQSVTVQLQSKWLGIAPWHEAKTYTYDVEKLDKATSDWVTVSSTSSVGFTFVIDPADGELFRITTNVEE